jgi:HAD superfamily hydrolase (TIGR01509 family)
VIKPDHRIFQMLAEQYKLKPERTVFLDDTEVNIQAARECGYMGIVFTSYAEAMEKLSSIGVKIS